MPDPVVRQVLNTGLFTLPEEMAQGFISKIRDRSTIAALAPASASSTLLNERYNLVTTEPEFAFVGESGEKPPTTMGVSSVVTGTYKAVGNIRITDELMIADEDTQMGLISEAIDSLSAAGARALDYGIYHAISPATGSAITGATALTSAAHTEAVTEDLLADMDGLPDDVIDAGYEFNGIALAPSFANELRKLRIGSDMIRAFPELGLNLRDTNNVMGVRAAVSNTVNGSLITPATGIKAIGGDFRLVKWGVVREMPARIIEFGDPDGQGDLQRTNEVILRLELIYKWVVADANGFVVLTEGESE